MQYIRCLLVILVFIWLYPVTVFSAESEEYITVPVEYSDKVGSTENLDLMVKDGNVYVNAERLADRLGYKVINSDKYIEIYNEDNSSLPIKSIKFFYESTQIEYLLFSKITDIYQTPCPSIKNDKGSWIPLEYSLLILNSGNLILDKSILIDIPYKNIIDYFYEVTMNAKVYNFDWFKDFQAFMEIDRAQSIFAFNRSLNLDGDLWEAVFQSFAIEPFKYDKKYAENSSLLICNESVDELKASVKKLEIYSDVLKSQGKIEEVLNRHTVNLDSEVDILYKEVEGIWSSIRDDNPFCSSYNRSYQALENAFDKQTWFSEICSNIIKEQRKISEFGSIYDIGWKVGEVVKYKNGLVAQEDFCFWALNEYLNTSTNHMELSQKMKLEMKDNYDIIFDCLGEHSLAQFFDGDVNGCLANVQILDGKLGMQARADLLEHMVLHNTPLIINEKDDVNNSLYLEILQFDAFWNYQELYNIEIEDFKELNAEKLYRLSQFCYIYLKLCYITRNMALETLINNGDYTEEELSVVNERVSRVQSAIANAMAVIKTANRTNEKNVYGFLPSDNENYLKCYDNSELITWIQNVKNTSSIFELMPKGFNFTSGAGGWRTHIDIEADGSFVGQYYDADIGVVGTSYPEGTVYICNFSGKFSEPVQINEYTYLMELEDIDVANVPNEIYYENGIKYICVEPYGFDNADKFLIYTPGAKITELPDGFVLWLSAFLNVEITENLPYYGIYNLSGEKGFVSYN